MVFDTVYYIYPPLGTGLESTRQSTWVRPIIDGEDETAIQGKTVNHFDKISSIERCSFRNAFARGNRYERCL